MKVVVAPDSFKGSLSAAEVAEAIALGLRQGWPGLEVDCVPLADGGEGTARIWVEACGGTWQQVSCCDSLGRPVTGEIGWVDGGRTAIVEAAQAVGLDLLTPEERDPWRATSYGLGELMAAALRSPQLETLWLTLGGTATVDGGIGCLQALGVAIADSTGTPVQRGGRGLEHIVAVDWSDRLDRRQPDRPHLIQLKIASDVTNPLLGDRGAARVFGPQKGADAEMVEALERGMENWVVRSGKADFATAAGAGAAGGLGFALACVGAEFCSGIDCVMAAVGLADRLQGADLAIVGEGCSDSQTAEGKVVSGVLRLARELAVPTVVLSGGVVIDEMDALEQLGAIAIWDAVPCPMSGAVAMARGKEHLQWMARQLARTLRLGQQLGNR